MAATRKQCREQLGVVLTTAFKPTVKRVFNHLKRSFSETAVMMIGPAGTQRELTTYAGHIPTYDFDVLIFYIRRQDGDESKLDDIDEQMTSFLDSNRTSDYWHGLTQVGQSDPSPVTLADGKDYWFELVTLRMTAK